MHNIFFSFSTLKRFFCNLKAKIKIEVHFDNSLNKTFIKKRNEKYPRSILHTPLEMLVIIMFMLMDHNCIKQNSVFFSVSFWFMGWAKQCNMFAGCVESVFFKYFVLVNFIFNKKAVDRKMYSNEKFNKMKKRKKIEINLHG